MELMIFYLVDVFRKDFSCLVEFQLRPQGSESLKEVISIDHGRSGVWQVALRILAMGVAKMGRGLHWMHAEKFARGVANHLGSFAMGIAKLTRARPKLQQLFIFSQQGLRTTYGFRNRGCETNPSVPKLQKSSHLSQWGLRSRPEHAQAAGTPQLFARGVANQFPNFATGVANWTRRDLNCSLALVATGVANYLWFSQQGLRKSSEPEIYSFLDLLRIFTRFDSFLDVFKDCKACPRRVWL